MQQVFGGCIMCQDTVSKVQPKGIRAPPAAWDGGFEDEEKVLPRKAPQPGVGVTSPWAPRAAAGEGASTRPRPPSQGWGGGDRTHQWWLAPPSNSTSCVCRRMRRDNHVGVRARWRLQGNGSGVQRVSIQTTSATCRDRFGVSPVFLQLRVTGAWSSEGL